jgi:hypothetical protein
VDTSFTGRAL